MIQSGEEHKEVLSNIHPFSERVEIVDLHLAVQKRDAIRIIWKEEFYHRAYQQGLDLSGSSDPSSVPIGFFDRLKGVLFLVISVTCRRPQYSFCV